MIRKRRLGVVMRVGLEEMVMEVVVEGGGSGGALLLLFEHAPGGC